MTGDIVVMSLGTQWRDPRPAFPRKTLLEVTRRRSTLGRAMSGRDGAGFYTNLWGLLPWTPRNGVIEEISTWRID